MQKEGGTCKRQAIGDYNPYAKGKRGLTKGKLKKNFPDKGRGNLQKESVQELIILMKQVEETLQHEKEHHDTSQEQQWS